MSGRDRFVEVLREVLDRRERGRSPLRTVRVLGRNTDGTLRQQRVDAECVTRGSAENAYRGETLSVPAGAGSSINRQGTSGIASVEAQTAEATLFVERLEPDVFLPGRSYSVSVIGRGFREGTRFEFLRPGPIRDVNEDVEMISTAFVSETEYRLNIFVVPGAVLYPDGAPLAYDRPGSGLS